MRVVRKAGAAAIAAVALGSIVAGPALAAPSTEVKSPESFLGSASGGALILSIGPNKISAGVSSAFADSALKAVAESSGLLGLPVVGGENAGKVEVIGSGANSTGEKCVTPAALQNLAGIVSLGAGCSSSLAEVTAAGPHALATGTVAKLGVDGASAVRTVDSVLASLPVGITVTDTLDTVLGTASPILQQVNDALPVDLALNDTVNELVTALLNVKTLDVKLGASKSEVTVDGDTVTSVATSEAGQIDILPLGAPSVLPSGIVELKPVVSIIIGSAKATAVYNRSTGVSTPSFDPAIVTVKINTPTTDALSDLLGVVDTRSIVVAPDLSVIPAIAGLAAPCADAPNEMCVLPGTPLETRIALASGRTFTNADGSVGAVADAVKIHALKNIGTLVSALEGGIKLELAHAEAGVGGKPAELVTLTVPDLPRELPRTGGTPWIPIAAVAALTAAIAGRKVLRRSHTS